MAAHVAPAAEHLLDVIDKRTNQPGPVLDIGSGHGGGLALARTRGHEAIGIDISLAQLRKDPTGSGTVAADAQRLPFANSSFGAAVSNFGLIFAPLPETALNEAHRCISPGGRLGFTAWIRGGWPDACRSILSEFTVQPIPPLPTKFGNTDVAASALHRAGFVDITSHEATLTWRFTNIDVAVETLTLAAGGLSVARRDIDKAGHWNEARNAVRTELHTRCISDEGALRLDDRYLLMVATRP